MNGMETSRIMDGVATSIKLEVPSEFPYTERMKNKINNPINLPILFIGSITVVTLVVAFATMPR